MIVLVLYRTCTVRTVSVQDRTVVHRAKNHNRKTTIEKPQSKTKDNRNGYRSVHTEKRKIETLPPTYYYSISSMQQRVQRETDQVKRVTKNMTAKM